MRIYGMGVNWRESRIDRHARGNSTDQSYQTKRFSCPDAGIVFKTNCDRGARQLALQGLSR
jgi:hypothetical protein